MNPLRHVLSSAVALVFVACGSQQLPQAKDPNTAEKAPIDRFSAAAGHLMVRDANAALPAANAAIDFDQGPFVTQGLGPAGNAVQYYNFDVQPVMPAPIYVLFHDGETTPVEGQLNIVETVPGQTGYNDFWQVMKVTVPKDFVPNTVTSLADITAAGYAVAPQQAIVNCPIVPAGSTATMRLSSTDTGLHSGWYHGMIVQYFNFAEKALMLDAAGHVPVSPIFVTFNKNPAEAGGGPPSGFVTEPSSKQTHNVVATTPSAGAYSPLWSVNVYDNAEFAQVRDLPSAQAATSLATGVATVNCPLVNNSTM